VKAKQLNMRRKSGRKDNNQARRRAKVASSRWHSREATTSPMIIQNATPDVSDGVPLDGVYNTNGAQIPPGKSLRPPVYRQPKSELEQATQRYVDLFDFAPIGYVTFDRVGRIEEINFAAVRLLGHTRRQLLGTSFAICVAPDDIQTFLDYLRECRSSAGSVVRELRLKRKNDKEIPVLLSSTAAFASMKDGARLYQTAIVDLTERKRAEQALRESQQRLQVTYEHALVGISECSPAGRYVGANEEFCRMLGCTREEILQHRIKDVTHKEDWLYESKLYRQLVAGEIPSYRIEKRFVRKDGAIIWTEMLRSIVRTAEGAPLYAIGAVRDITQQKETEAQLKKSKELLEQRVRARTRELHRANKELISEIERRKGLEGEILSVSDREQQRLGQELHDGLCQHLTAVAFMARSVAMRLKKHRVVDADDIDKIAELINEAASDTRDLSRALHRSDVDAAGLVDALQDLADREIWRTPCRVDVTPSFQIDDDTTAAHLYRIAREAVINANKHAHATEIVIKLEQSQRGIVLRVLDNGIGLPNEQALKRGLGFHIMNYRADLIGGHLLIESPKRGGTSVSCYLTKRAPGAVKSQQTNGQEELAAKAAAAVAADAEIFQHLKQRPAANG